MSDLVLIVIIVALLIFLLAGLFTILIITAAKHGWADLSKKREKKTEDNATPRKESQEYE